MKKIDKAYIEKILKEVEKSLKDEWNVFRKECVTKTLKKIRSLLDSQGVEAVLEHTEAPDWAWWYATAYQGERVPELEDIIARDGYWAATYATLILNAPFPKGEPAIAASDDVSYQFYWHSFPERKEILDQLKEKLCKSNGQNSRRPSKSGRKR